MWNKLLNKLRNMLVGNQDWRAAETERHVEQSNKMVQVSSDHLDVFREDLRRADLRVKRLAAKEKVRGPN